MKTYQTDGDLAVVAEEDSTIVRALHIIPIESLEEDSPNAEDVYQGHIQRTKELLDQFGKTRPDNEYNNSTTYRGIYSRWAHTKEPSVALTSPIRHYLTRGKEDTIQEFLAEFKSSIAHKELPQNNMPSQGTQSRRLAAIVRY